MMNIQNKIKLLFEKLGEPGFVMNNYYADGLINKLCDNKDPEISFLANIPLISDLVTDAMSQTENAHISVKVFLTRLLAIVSSSELHFVKIISQKGDLVLRDFNIINLPHINPSLRVAYMEVALAFISHDSGMSWILQQGVWKEILSVGIEKRTVFVVRQTYKFASTFLWRLNDLADEANIRLVLSHVLKPLADTDFFRIQAITSEEEEEISKTVEPMLQTLLSLVSENDRIEKSSQLMSILLNDLKLTSYLYMIFDRMRREDITMLLTRLIFWLCIAKLFQRKPLTPDTEYVTDDFMDISVMFFNTIQCLNQRRSPVLVIDFCNSCNLIWTTLWKYKNISVQSQGNGIKLQNQMLIVCLVPCLVFVKKNGSKLGEMTNESLNQFVTKLLNSLCEHTARAAYSLRDLTYEMDTTSVTLQSVKRMSCLKTHLNTEQANLIFQALFYVLQEYDPLNENGEMKEDDIDDQDKVQVMTYVLDTVSSLVKEYDINWTASLEVTCLYTVVSNILKRRNLTCKFIVTGLKLLETCVKKFLAPNLTLLMESKPGSSLHELGQLIYMRMNDRNWEVRDSALELLHACIEISFVKYPSFQKQILESNTIKMAATIALNDPEFYTQVSALKCIAAASKVSSIWEQMQGEFPNIQDQLISILHNSQEGIVRQHACLVLCTMYQSLKLTPQFKRVLCEHMVSAALSDFHWEVQLSALKFWRVAINSYLSDQGMLDGKFPPVTFSRETRKIVTLNENEIQKRLIKILDDLSSNGCLTVLVKLLSDETEVEIIEAALSIAQNLLNILNEHKVPELLKPNPDSPQTVDEVMCCIKEDEDYNTQSSIDEPESTQKADNVIESILNANDINLLSNIYERHMKLQNEAKEKPVKPRITLSKFVSPYLFVNYLISKDFKAVVNEKKNWKDGIKNLSSLLDDVLGIYDASDEVNVLDCY